MSFNWQMDDEKFIYIYSIYLQIYGIILVCKEICNHEICSLMSRTIIDHIEWDNKVACSLSLENFSATLSDVSTCLIWTVQSTEGKGMVVKLGQLGSNIEVKNRVHLIWSGKWKGSELFRELKFPKVKKWER